MLKITSVSRLRGAFRRIGRDERGVSAVEFALLLPLMLVLYFGAVEVSQAVAVDRKVTLSARSVADLVAQAQSVNTTEVNDILDAASTVTAPYSAANLKVTVSQIKIDAQGTATVSWSDARNTTAKAPGSAVTIPTALQIPNTYLILGEVQYTYKPVLGYVVTGTLNLKDQIYMRPRQGASVTRN